MLMEWNELREDIIGRDATILTPYGERVLCYADYTASGRGLHSIERYIEHLLELYANTHTEDDSTGLVTSWRLSTSEALIRQRLNADERYKLIAPGAGATAAIARLQQILGIYLPPATRDRLGMGMQIPAESLPVVFVGPYEHHSNEISWREGLCEVVEIELDDDGRLSLTDLEQRLADPTYAGREKIGSFSAASNVTGILTDVYETARILHRHGARAFFDYSACAPYVAIDVNHDEETYFDGVFFSPHKFLGGPGAGGVLLIREDLYRRDLPPSLSGGGTVRFVNATSQDYLEDIEEREKAGTPGILQTIRTALVLDLQHQIGIEEIERREAELVAWANERLRGIPGLELVGSAEPGEKIAIFAFNIRAAKRYLHPRFVVRLLNDLFGIQSRAGCSCAGPYGHRLLHIDLETSERYRRSIQKGLEGVKPGWVRLNFHYLIDDNEFDFLCDAIAFVTRYGERFLLDYRFDEHRGSWEHVDGGEEIPAVGIGEALALGVRRGDDDRTPPEQVAGMRREYLRMALERAEVLAESFREDLVHETQDAPIPFLYVALAE
jgi:selenocysteine lyase/cysteine desulfurase